MNPDSPKTPREEMEAWLTSLLLGELSEGEAAAVRELMKHDPELAKLHDRLQQSIALLREAEPKTSASTASAESLKLSDERRQRLLTAFKIPPLKPAAHQPKPFLQFGRLQLIAVLVILAFSSFAIISFLGGSRRERGYLTQFSLFETLGDSSEETADRKPKHAADTSRRIQFYGTNGNVYSADVVGYVNVDASKLSSATPPQQTVTFSSSASANHSVTLGGGALLTPPASTPPPAPVAAPAAAPAPATPIVLPPAEVASFAEPIVPTVVANGAVASFDTPVAAASPVAPQSPGSVRAFWDTSGRGVATVPSGVAETESAAEGRVEQLRERFATALKDSSKLEAGRKSGAVAGGEWYAGALVIPATNQVRAQGGTPPQDYLYYDAGGVANDSFAFGLYATTNGLVRGPGGSGGGGGGGNLDGFLFQSRTDPQVADALSMAPLSVGESVTTLDSASSAPGLAVIDPSTGLPASALPPSVDPATGLPVPAPASVEDLSPGGGIYLGDAAASSPAPVTTLGANEPRVTRRLNLAGGEKTPVLGDEGDFGRFKPDVVAPGTFVVPTRSAPLLGRLFHSSTNVLNRGSMVLSNGQTWELAGYDEPSRFVPQQGSIASVNGRTARVPIEARPPSAYYRLKQPSSTGATLTVTSPVATNGTPKGVALRSVRRQTEVSAAQKLAADGKLLFESGKLDEAKAKLAEALKANPNSTDAAYYLAAVNESKYQEAERRRELSSKDRVVKVEQDWSALNKAGSEALTLSANHPFSSATNAGAYFAKKRELEELYGFARVLGVKLASENVDLKLQQGGTSMVEIMDRATAAKDKTGLWRSLGVPVGGSYASAVRLKVEREVPDIEGMAGSRSDSACDPYFIQNEFEAIQSEAVLGKVVGLLSLDETWAKQRGRTGKLKTMDAVSLLKSKLTLKPVRNTSQIEIRVNSEDADESARIANAVADVYLSQRTSERLSRTTSGIKALEERYSEQQAKIKKAVRELEDLRTHLNISDADAQGNSPAPALKVEPDVPLPRRAATNAPIPQPEIQTSENNFSTFSLNVSDVSFKLAMASLEKGQMPDAASIRSEEFINAFDYRDPEPAAGAPIAFAWERARYPFAHNRDLLRFSLKTAALGRQAGRPLNIVLLLDNSGSMERADRVQIIREALQVLAAQLQPQDKFSVIMFSRTARLVADGIAGDKAGEVAEQVSGLTPQGGTNLEDAMNLAYQTAAKHYLANGINRVVLLTDGAANLGDVEPESLKNKVETHRRQGIALDAFGIGWEGFNDDLLEVLSRNGDGRYGFINSPEEAATEFAGQLAGALKVAASDVKVQVEFNPKRVTSYRQIGYAKHQLTKEQFRDNTVDAAEIAAQEAGNALYTVEVNPAGDGPLCTVRVRYKIPGTTDYREQAWDVPFAGNALALEQSSVAMRLAASASAFAEWLVASPFAGEVTPDRVLGVLSGVPEIYGADARPRKLEWMIRQAKSLEGK